MTRSILILASVVVLLGGCASTVKKSDESAPVPVGVKATGKAVVLNMTGSTVATTAKDWTDFKGVWREKCAEEFASAGALFSMQEGEPRPTGRPELWSWSTSRTIATSRRAHASC